MSGLAPGHFSERLVVGLGNPGPRYACTRHNVGFRVLDKLALRLGAGPWRIACSSLVTQIRLAGRPVTLAKPQTYMNRSGVALLALLAATGIGRENAVLVYDDLDLPFGRLRVRESGGHGGHNGVRSVIDALGSGEFARLRIGIGRPPDREGVIDYVLSPFSPEEECSLEPLLGRASEAAECLLTDGIARAMNRFPT